MKLLYRTRDYAFIISAKGNLFRPRETSSPDCLLTLGPVAGPLAVIFDHMLHTARLIDWTNIEISVLYPY